MFPILFDTPSVPIPAYGTMVTLAFVVGLGMTHLRAPRMGFNPDTLVPLYILLGGFGILGARLLHFLMAERDVFFNNPLIVFNLQRSGMAFLGGALGGLTAGGLYAWRRGLNGWKLADLMMPNLMLAYALGRMGCFLAGCCHGGVCPNPVAGDLLGLPGGTVLRVEGFPWVALRFNDLGVGALAGEVLFPSQLLEVATGLCLFGVLSWMWGRARRFDGQVLAAFLVLYAVARASAEGFRGDAIRGLYAVGPMELSTSQLVAIGMVIAGCAITAMKARGGMVPEIPYEPPELEA